MDRVRSPSPAAELLLECALAQTASRPTILVLDSLKRLKKFSHESSTSHKYDPARGTSSARISRLARGPKLREYSSAGRLRSPARRLRSDSSYS